MRNQWFISVIFMFILLMPNPVSTNAKSAEPQVIELMEPVDTLPRVYGEDLSREIFASVDQDRYKSYVQEFTENGSRDVYFYNTIPGSVNEISRHWLVNKMTELSNERLEIEIIGEYMSIVGSLPGYLPGDNPVFVISAHYDTKPLCPGANDAGAGIAAVLELLGIMSQYEWPLDIYFIAFNGAEARFDQLTPPPGRLQGSEEVARILDDRDIDILALFDVGPILREANNGPHDERVFLSYYDGGGIFPYIESRYWAELGKAMSNWYGGDFVQTIPSSSFIEYYRADIRKFIERDYYNAVLAFETGLADDTAYQTADDLWNRNDYSYRIGREVTALIGGCMAFSMSRSYGGATRLIFEGIAQSSFPLQYIVPVSMATTINITGRWFGSSANFFIYNPLGSIIGSSVQTSTHPWTYTNLFSIPVTEKGLYLIEVWDTSINSLGVELEIDYEVDANLNGISDQYEYWLDTSLFSIDSDSDSISNAMEIIYGTDGNKADSDDDIMPDNWELDNGLDPTDPTDANMDSDGDSLTNLQEYSNGLDPNSADSDSDQIPDGWEIENGLDPLVNDADENPDEDDYTNLEEYLRGSDPQTAEVENPPYLTWIGIPSAAVVLIGLGIYMIRRNRMMID
ncbi:M28 family peptidase [Candidatus Thorarchaeota archaeon]|nr:MAG: M28 family peptidase [Candidatus Thorarchaeota archaeon]